MAIVLATVVGLSIAALMRTRPAHRDSFSARLHNLLRPLPAFAVAGLGLILLPQRRALPLRVAALSATVAVAAGVAGLGLGGSVHHLLAHPSGYGTSWDGAITGSSDPFLDDRNHADALQAARAAPDVAAAGGAVFKTEARVERLAVPVVAFWSLVGPPQSWPVMTKGRAPKTLREVALGPKTMRALDLAVGDETEVRLSPDGLPKVMTVVGEALVNDGFTVEAGEVAVVDANWFASDRSRGPDMILLRASTPHPNWRSIEDAGLTLLDPPPPPVFATCGASTVCRA